QAEAVHVASRVGASEGDGALPASDERPDERLPCQGRQGLLVETCDQVADQREVEGPIVQARPIDTFEDDGDGFAERLVEATAQRGQRPRNLGKRDGGEDGQRREQGWGQSAAGNDLYEHAAAVDERRDRGEAGPAPRRGGQVRDAEAVAL